MFCFVSALNLQSLIGTCALGASFLGAILRILHVRYLFGLWFLEVCFLFELIRISISFFRHWFQGLVSLIFWLFIVIVNHCSSWHWHPLSTFNSSWLCRLAEDFTYFEHYCCHYLPFYLRSMDLSKYSEVFMPIYFNQVLTPDRHYCYFLFAIQTGRHYLNLNSYLTKIHVYLFDIVVCRLIQHYLGFDSLIMMKHLW